MAGPYRGGPGEVERVPPGVPPAAAETIDALEVCPLDHRPRLVVHGHGGRGRQYDERRGVLYALGRPLRVGNAHGVCLAPYVVLVLASVLRAGLIHHGAEGAEVG
jgi:hypothetical protein